MGMRLTRYSQKRPKLATLKGAEGLERGACEAVPRPEATRHPSVRCSAARPWEWEAGGSGAPRAVGRGSRPSFLNRSGPADGLVENTSEAPFSRINLRDLTYALGLTCYRRRIRDVVEHRSYECRGIRRSRAEDGCCCKRP